MYKITFIGTVHNENGLCNHNELLKIIHEISPEVIFEEIRPIDFELFYKHKWYLESKAVSKYCENKTIKQVPVDHYVDPDILIPDFKKTLESIFEYVENRSKECYQIMEEIDRKTCRFGFEYLNSNDYARRWASIYKIQDEVVLATGNQSLIKVLKLWRDMENQRNIEMINNIYEYSKNNPFNIGVFLVEAISKIIPG